MGPLSKRLLRLGILAEAIRQIETQANAGGDIRVLPGDPAATARLRAVLGVARDDDLAPDRGLLVHVAVPGADPGPAARALAARARGQGPALAILTGPDEERRALERAFLAEDGLTIANLVHVPVLDPAHGAAAVRVAVARALGPEATAAGRRRPELRTAVARSLSQSAAREAGVMAAVGLVAGNTYAQARLTQRLAAVSGREMGAERIPEVVVAMCAGTASAILARQATRAIGPGWLVRAGVSYATTLLVADATARWLERGGAAAERPLSALRALVESRAGRDGGGDGASGPPPDPMETVRAALARVRGRGRG